MARRALATAVALAALAIAGCGGSGDDTAPGQPAPGSISLRVMTFNIWYAYAEVARDRVVALENVHMPCCPYGPQGKSFTVR